MKKLYFFISVFVLSVFLVGCTHTPNMSELLNYQENDWEMQIKIKESQESFHIKAKKTADGITLILEDENRKSVGYHMDTEGKIAMVYEELKIPMEETPYLKCTEWFSCLNLSVGESIWRIKKERFGGIDVFVCSDGYFTVYIDCESRQPLKIQTKKTEMDIISVG